MSQVMRALEDILRRLIRLETKVAKLMEHSGLAADGRSKLEDKPT